MKGYKPGLNRVVHCVPLIRVSWPTFFQREMAEEENGAAGGGGGEFYLRYYVGHKGKFGHEFLEFEFRPDGKLRYANNSNYKNDTMIRKEVFLTPSVLKECRRIVSDSEVCHLLYLCLILFLRFNGVRFTVIIGFVDTFSWILGFW